jgi:hypothetical protein
MSFSREIAIFEIQEKLMSHRTHLDFLDKKGVSPHIWGSVGQQKQDLGIALPSDFG